MNDIQDAIHDRMTHNNLLPGAQLQVGNRLLVPTCVASEEGLRAHADLELNTAAKGVLAAFGIEGEFTPVADSGKVAFVGDPNFLWVRTQDSMHPKLVVRGSTRFMRLC